MKNNHNSKTTKPIDWDLCVEIIGGNTELAERLLCKFIEHIDKIKTEFRGLVDVLQSGEDINYESLEFKLHGLKGSSYYCGVQKLIEIIVDLECALSGIETVEIENMHEKRYKIECLLIDIEKEIDRIIYCYKSSEYLL